MYIFTRYFNEKLLYRDSANQYKGDSLLHAMNGFKLISLFLRHFPKALSGLDKKTIKILMTFAEIEPFTYLCTVKEIMIELIKKSDEFSVKLIRWLS